VDETALPFIIPKSGNNPTGNKLVTDMGMAWVIHQVAINAATAKVEPTAGFSGSIFSKNKRIKTMGPRIKPTDFVLIDFKAKSLSSTINFQYIIF
jgi:hypothetical protein